MMRLPTWALLIVLVIFGAFYIGLSTDMLAFSRGAQQILYALSGRTQSGTFAGYPTGAPNGPYQDPFRTAQ